MLRKFLIILLPLMLVFACKEIDKEAPTINIKLNEQNVEVINISVGQDLPVLLAQAFDSEGNDISSSIIKSGNIDLSVAGEYQLSYTVKDSRGKESKKVIKIVISSDTLAPVAGGGGLLSVKNLTETGFELNWEKATDLVTKQPLLEYFVYSIDANHALVEVSTKWDRDISFYNIENLVPKSHSEILKFTVAVRDASGNVAFYEEKELTSLADTTPPVASNLDIIFEQAQRTVSFSVVEASDNVSPSSELKYFISYVEDSGDLISDYESLSASDFIVKYRIRNVGSVSTAIFGKDFFLPTIDYYVFAFVQDEAGNFLSYNYFNLPELIDGVSPVVGGRGVLSFTDQGELNPLFRTKLS
ncbi:MAG: DUF5011 domain-containing protein [Spirochaetales bacterium]|nr:DUF5011 domain-containing protein [Spirochaetales bacterium]